MVSGTSARVGLICSGGVLAAVAGFIALLGWGLGLPVLASLGSGYVPMAPSAAALFVFYGVATVLRARSPLHHSAYWLAVVVHCLGALVALILLVLSANGIQPHAEHLGFAAVGAVGSAPIGHMSPVSALGFLLASLSFLASLPHLSNRPWRAVMARGSAGLLLVACFSLLIAYLYGAPLLYGSAFIPPALPTCLAFVALGIALLTLAGPQTGPLSELRSSTRSELVLVLVFIFLAVGILTGGYVAFQRYSAQYRTAIEHELSSIADLKAAYLTQYRKERLGDASIFFENASFSGLMGRVLDRPGDADAQAQLLTSLERYQAHYQYDQVRLLDAQGVTHLSVPAGLGPASSTLVRGASDVLRSGQPAFQDFYRDEYDHRIYLAVLTPILGVTDANHPLGVIVMRIDPETYLYPFIKRWPTSSATAETLLLRQDGNDVLYLNDLRHQSNAALALRLPLERTEVPAVQGVLGQTGIIQGVDYRGVPVIVDVRAVPDSPWVLVAKMDTAEAYEQLYERLWQMVVLIGSLLLSAGTSVGLVWWHQRSQFYKEQALGAEALRASELRYRRLFESAKDGILILDAETGMVADVNPFLIELLGFSREGFLGKKIWELGFFKDVVANQSRFTELQQQEYVRYDDKPLESADGRRIDVEFVSNVYRVNHHKVIHCNIRDITERRRVEKTLIMIMKAVESSSEAVGISDAQGRHFYQNRALSELFEYATAEELQAAGGGPAVVKDPEVARQMFENIKSGNSWSGDLEMVTKSGRVFPAYERADAIKDEAGHLIGLIGIIADFTERKRMEHLLRTQAHVLNEAQRSAHVGSWDRDAVSGTLIWSEELHRIFGRDPELPGLRFEDLAQLYTPKSWSQLRAAVEKTLQTGAAFELDVEIVRPDGTVIWGATRCEAVRDTTGQIVGTRGTVLDITERKRAENNTLNLLEITKHIAGALTLADLLDTVQRRIAEALPCDIVVTLLPDPVGDTLRIAGHYGIPPDLLAPVLALKFRANDHWGGRFTKGESLVIDDFSAPGLPAELNRLPLGALVAVPLRVHGQYFGRLCAVRGRDRPPFTAAEVELFAGITQQVAIGIETVQLYAAQQEDTMVSRALARLGAALSAALHTPLLVERLCQVATEILEANVSVVFLRRSNEPVWVGVTRYGDTPDEIWESFRTQPIPEAPIAVALERIDRAGVLQFRDAEIAGLLPASLAALVRQSGLTAVVLIALRCDGKLVGVQATSWRGGPERLSTQHERIARGIIQVASGALENKRILDDLARANQIKSDFMSTMSHELRTPLNVILGYNALLLEGVFGSLGADQEDTLQRAQKSAQELHSLLTDTLDIGRLETGTAPADVQEVDLNELQREIAAEAISLGVNPTVAVVWDVPTELPRLYTDRAKLKVVIKNLLTNGVKFTSQGQVTVRARACDGGAEITVTDTGIGISPDALPIIFEAFRQGDSSTTRLYGGTGLGLYIVRRYMDVLGGTISVESVLGRGSSFRVWLPLAPPIRPRGTARPSITPP